MDFSVQESDLVTSSFSKIDGHDCQQHFNALGGSYQQLVVLFFLIDIHLQALILMPWMFPRQVNIFLPGLFVPALFMMHDVSLTPTKKVA
ncbi:hypothetical protein K492DRAFT_174529 [Lichtheimia hyalospora FSU 10163]|nr:hypothetical protein K492DRAFT_174529 [Lichtheimia hyalospora FSU 10163]